MSKGHNRHSTVGKAFEIDRAAIKIFDGWLPNNWLPRKQDPDFFVDYLVEIVENSEPSGKHFAAQVKGYEDARDEKKVLKYPFATKHLKYYLHRSQHPVVLFLINVTTGEGYWLFAQKFLKEKVPHKILDSQDSFTIHFSAEDSLLNSTKFKCLLPEAEKFVRDLHPGSIKAALEKRKADLEAIDPRCSISISVENGNEHVVVTPNEPFSFTTKLTTQAEDAWQRLFERGEKIKIKREDLEFLGAPLMQEVLRNAEDELEIRYGKETRGSIHIINKTEPIKFIPIEGWLKSGTKILSFRGELPDSPLSISFEITWDEAFKAEPYSLSMSFQPKKWIGQPILNLPYFDQISSFADAFSGGQNPEMDIFVQGNSIQKGVLNNDGGDVARGIKQTLDWFQKCKWLAHQYKLNPPYPPFEKFGKKQMKELERLYYLLKNQGVVVPRPHFRLEGFVDKITQPNDIAKSDRILRIEKPEQEFDFFGTIVRLAPMRHIFTEMELVSQTPLDNGKIEIVLCGTKDTTLTSNFI